MQFKDKVVWITGASSGIGKALAVELDNQGARLILTSRQQEALENLCQSLTGDGHIVLTADLIETTDFDSLVNRAWSCHQRIDLLVNNAGISQRSLSLQTAHLVEERIMALDFWAPVKITKALVPKMINSGGGCIINIASMTAKIGSPGRTAYTAAKHALLGYMDCFRAEVAHQNIHIKNVCPGFVKTNISRNALKGDASRFEQLDDEIRTGMPVEKFIQKMLRQLDHKDELIIAKGLPRLGYWVYKISPAMYRKVLEKVYKKQDWQT